MTAYTLTTGLAGNLDGYIQMVNRIPLLSAQEEHRLATEYRRHHNLESARQLVLSHLRLVVSTARNYLGYGLPHEDLIQEGNIGLMKAVKRFDPDKKNRLVSYALHWIKSEIHDYILRNWRIVKIATTKAQRKLFFNLRSHKRGRTFSPQEIDDLAESLEVKRSDVREMEIRLTGSDMALDNSARENDESFSCPLHHLTQPGDEPSEILAARDFSRLESEGLQAALDALDERSRQIIESRWLDVGEDGSGATLKSLGEKMGLSAERVRQIQSDAMQEMRTVLQAY